jgi:hypothetical protein
MVHGRLSSMIGSFREQRPTKKPNRLMMNEHAGSRSE